MNNPSSPIEGDAFTVSGNLLRDDTGARLPGETIRISIDGTPLSSTQTNASGAYSFSVTVFSPGNHTMTVSYSGGSCGTTCELACQDACLFSCQTSCEYDCKTTCEVSCQSSCQLSCKTGCQVSCQTSCELGDCKTTCQLACQTACESSCQTGCQLVCQLDRLHYVGD